MSNKFQASKFLCQSGYVDILRKTRILSLKATHLIAAGETRRRAINDNPTLKASNKRRLIRPLQGRCGRLRLTAGYNPPLLNLSLSATFRKYQQNLVSNESI